MTLFIIGCILAGLVVIGVPLFCILLLKNEKRIKKLGWRTGLIVAALAVMAVIAIIFLFVGHGQMQS